MSTQKRELGKNYIDLLIDRDEVQRAIELTAPTGLSVRKYFRGLAAALFDRRSDAS